MMLLVVFLAGINFSYGQLHGSHICRKPVTQLVRKNVTITTMGLIDAVGCYHVNKDGICTSSGYKYPKMGIKHKVVEKTVQETFLHYHCCHGYAEDEGKCKKVVHCGKENCFNAGKCVKGKCDCRGTGYTGPECREDVDECKEKKDTCEQRCTNTIGSYKCSCNDNYDLVDTSRCTLNGYYCRIDNKYYPSGYIKDCMKCDPRKDQFQWSPADGLFCFVLDDDCFRNTYCSNGKCVGTPYKCTGENQKCDGYGGCKEVRNDYQVFEEFKNVYDYEKPRNVENQKDSVRPMSFLEDANPMKDMNTRPRYQYQRDERFRSLYSLEDLQEKQRQDLEEERKDEEEYRRFKAMHSAMDSRINGNHYFKDYRKSPFYFP